MSTRPNPRTFTLIFADILIIYGAILAAIALRTGIDGAFNELSDGLEWGKIALATAVCLAALYLFDLYDYAVIKNRRELKLRLIQAVGSAWILLAVVYYFVPRLMIGRGTAVYSLLITLALLLAIRSVAHYVLGHPGIGERVLIIGDGPAAEDAARAVLERPDAGFRIAGFLSLNSNGLGLSIPGIQSLGTVDDLEYIITSEKIDRIVIGVRERRGTFPAESLLKLRLAGNVCIEECASFIERITGQVHLDMLRPSWLIFSDHSRETQTRVLSREIVHRSLALIGLITSIPIAIVTAILIKLESGGNCLYRQERVGKNGRTFQLIKFRSMRNDAEADGRPVWAAPDDDRVTRVGRIIRKVRVDEIPQFWNILRGQMNFVGPRPERPFFVASLAEDVPYYEYRHLVAPGLTGWAQIKYPYGSSIEDARQKLQFDLYYIKNQSLTLDLVIFLETFKIILFGRGGR